MLRGPERCYVVHCLRLKKSYMFSEKVCYHLEVERGEGEPTVVVSLKRGGRNSGWATTFCAVAHCICEF